MTVRAKIDKTSAQEGSQFPESDRCELCIAMGTERSDIIFFDKLDHFFLLITYTFILEKIFCK